MDERRDGDIDIEHTTERERGGEGESDGGGKRCCVVRKGLTI